MDAEQLAEAQETYLRETKLIRQLNQHATMHGHRAHVAFKQLMAHGMTAAQVMDLELNEGRRRR